MGATGMMFPSMEADALTGTGCTAQAGVQERAMDRKIAIAAFGAM